MLKVSADYTHISISNNNTIANKHVPYGGKSRINPEEWLERQERDLVESAYVMQSDEDTPVEDRIEIEEEASRYYGLLLLTLTTLSPVLRILTTAISSTDSHPLFDIVHNNLKRHQFLK